MSARMSSMDYEIQKKCLERAEQRNYKVSICALLNDDIMLSILRYLTVPELLKAAQVCKKWRYLVAYRFLWKTVRLRNCEITDWTGLAKTLKRRRTQNLDLSDVVMLDKHEFWNTFFLVISRVTSIVNLELCECNSNVINRVFKKFPQLKVLSATSIRGFLNLKSIDNLKCHDLRLKMTSTKYLRHLTFLQNLTQLKKLSLKSVRDLESNIDVIQTLTNLESLELGYCNKFPETFGTTVLQKFKKLRHLRLERCAGYFTFDILKGISKLENLIHLELIYVDILNGFDIYLANCKNIKKLLLVPNFRYRLQRWKLHRYRNLPLTIRLIMYLLQSAKYNNIVLKSITRLSNTLTHFIWGFENEFFLVMEDFTKLSDEPRRGRIIPVLKPVPCLNLIKNTEIENQKDRTNMFRFKFQGKKETQGELRRVLHTIKFLSLNQFQELFSLALPKTKFESFLRDTSSNIMYRLI